ncbi:MAG: hypothetical protein ACE5JD_13380 [Candidatus Methylomirabilia bacterium]
MSHSTEIEVRNEELRLALTVLLELKSAWADGTSHLLFEPLELLEKLAALIPRPRINLVVYHGVLAPHACWRRRAVAYEGSGIPARTPRADSAAFGAPKLQGEAPGKPRYWAWADLMRRAFEIDVLACPRCGGRMRLIAPLLECSSLRRSLPQSRRGPHPSCGPEG